MQQRIRVLIADDSSLARAMLREILQTQPDIEVVGEACNGQQAVDMAQTLSPQLITMDLEMPVMGGRDVMRLIRENKNYNHINIIVHTNMSNDNMEHELEKAGANAIIGKVNMLKLGEAINELII